MKKVYTKPQIAFESFIMSTNIASNCDGVPVNNPTKGVCGVVGSGGDTLFSEKVSGCSIDWILMNGGVDDYNGFCYHTPTEYNNLFNS